MIINARNRWICLTMVFCVFVLLQPNLHSQNWRSWALNASHILLVSAVNSTRVNNTTDHAYQSTQFSAHIVQTLHGNPLEGNIMFINGIDRFIMEDADIEFGEASYPLHILFIDSGKINFALGEISEVKLEDLTYFNERLQEIFLIDTITNPQKRLKAWAPWMIRCLEKNITAGITEELSSYSSFITWYEMNDVDASLQSWFSHDELIVLMKYLCAHPAQYDHFNILSQIYYLDQKYVCDALIDCMQKMDEFDRTYLAGYAMEALINITKRKDLTAYYDAYTNTDKKMSVEYKKNIDRFIKAFRKKEK